MNGRWYDWSIQGLELGKPACMDTPTLIEWIQRQLETPEETRSRHCDMEFDYLEFEGVVEPHHRRKIHEIAEDLEETAVYVDAQVEPIAVFKTGGVISTNEARAIRGRYLGWSEDLNARSSIMVLPSNVDTTYF